ncbi:MAG: site-specific integrase [Planctomycetota bacterium]|nr:MAG: site-specific integrase [Planctomycetota bacterium]
MSIVTGRLFRANITTQICKTGSKKISRDPLDGLRIKEPKPTRQPCWTPEEVEQILNASQGTQRTAFTLLADTGMRVGEAKWLNWEDIDFKRGVLHIRAKDGWKPKSGDARTVPMSPRIRELLAGLDRRGPWVLRAAPSRKHPRGDGQLSERRLLQSLKRVLKRLGLHGHLHTFRHAFISHALMAGTPEAIVRDWVGHVDDKIIQMYTHVADAESQRAMARLAEARCVSDPENVESCDVPSTTEPQSAQI